MHTGKVSIKRRANWSQGQPSASGSWEPVISEALFESWIRFLLTSSSPTMCFLCRGVRWIDWYVADHVNIKFANEKHLKGQELFNQNGWDCPLTGELKPIIVDSDFCNSHTIIRCCGIAPDAPPFYFWMHDGTNDATMFSDILYLMVVDGFLRNGDVLVIGNASIHRYCKSAVLEEILWEDYKILIFFMPARSPELNPIKLMWNILVQHLRRVQLTGRNTSERTPLAAKYIMNEFTHSQVASCYRKCNYIL